MSIYICTSRRQFKVYIYICTEETKMEKEQYWFVAALGNGEHQIPVSFMPESEKEALNTVIKLKKIGMTVYLGKMVRQ